MPCGYGIYFPHHHDEAVCHILREASARLLVQLIRAMRRPQVVGRVKRNGSHAFFISYKRICCEPRIPT